MTDAATRHNRARAAGMACLTGIAPWKRLRLAAMFGVPVIPDPRAAVARARRDGGAIGVWASRVAPDLPARAADAGVALWMVEDGFLRSRGLGAALTPPASCVVDRSGIHYNARCPSDLETLLATRRWDADALRRAAALRAAITAAGVTKYNLAGALPDLPAGRRLVLVPGQVEDDRSVATGGGGMTMAALLRAVRADEPEAWILYKPHPDVVAGLRTREEGVAGLADQVVADAELLALIERVDEVHTLTSLAGFEALIRGVPVTTHGQPFYAGWGLTRDHRPVARRTRSLSIDELVAGVLIDYPLYVDPVTGAPCSPEALVATLAAGPRVRAHGGLAARAAAWLARRKGRA